MPDKKGRLSDAEIETILDWIKEKAPKTEGTCTVCGENQWRLGQFVFAPVTYGNGYLFGESVYPLVVTMCGNCGHSVFFNAAHIGLKQYDPKQDPDKKKTKKITKKAVPKKKEKKNG